MPDWMSQEELLRDAGIFLKLIHVISGVYFWEFVVSLDFEWLFISRKKSFQWPMIFYFAGRYSMLFTLIGLLIAVNVTHELDCQALYGFVGLFGQMCTGFPSLILAVRTMVIWGLDRYVVIGLTLVIMGHWAILLQGAVIHAQYIPGQGCSFTPAHHNAIFATFIYSVCFDSIVLCLTAYKLIAKRKNRSQLVKLMFQDGLFYFVAALVANIPAMVMMALNFNPVISVMFNIPAAVIATTVACRAVRRLSTFSLHGPEMFSSKSNPSHGQSANALGGTRPPPAIVSTHPRPTDGVHVQMATFTVTDGDSDHKVQQKFDPEQADFDGRAY